MTNVDEGYKVYERLLVNYFNHLGREIVDIEMNSK
jgi:hypothetical protein